MQTAANYGPLEHATICGSSASSNHIKYGKRATSSAQEMAWDSKSSRRRQSSNAATTSRPAHPHPIPVSHEHYPAKSSHVADPSLQPFLAPSFDAADFLNAALPSLQSINSAQRAAGNEAPLAELSTETQTLLSNLGTHTSRLTNTLTQLTDEIIRSGSRLAYEVEVLRGETLGLSEALTEGLQDDIVKFVPGGVDERSSGRPSRTTDNDGPRRRSSTITVPKTPALQSAFDGKADPEYITQLRTLTSVRMRLDTVIKMFGDAMAWTFPPSEVSVSSAFLSVSAPEPGSEEHSVEEKGQQVSKKLRDEIADLLIRGDDPIDCIAAAAKRVEELKILVEVWKGTAEEKARTKFVESLAKMVEDRHRDLLREAEQDGRANVKTETSRRSMESNSNSAYGFINQLQKMRGGL